MSIEAAQKKMDKKSSVYGKQTDGYRSFLSKGLVYLEAYCTCQLSKHFGKEAGDFPVTPLPDDHDMTPLANFVRHYELTHEELTILLIAIVPYILPGFFDSIIQRFLPQGGDFPEFGGIKGQHHRGTLPTGETALFILAGSDVQKRLRYLSFFDDHSFLFKQHVLSLEPVRSGE
ncbi:MAG TPA: hypothetical protein VE912_15670, partial [Bacteroidales bacterium]|nr:hypothetical protein [Bacteroidales bacterium]